MKRQRKTQEGYTRDFSPEQGCMGITRLNGHEQGEIRTGTNLTHEPKDFVQRFFAALGIDKGTHKKNTHSTKQEEEGNYVHSSNSLCVVSLPICE